MRRLSWITLLSLLAACAAREPSSGKAESLRAHVHDMSLVVVVLDAAAAGHFSFLGYERPTTPFLDELARESVVFEAAYAQASATPLSTLSYFTSRYPLIENMPRLAGELAPTIPVDIASLPVLMGRRFARRLGVSANRWVAEDFGHARGFTHFEQVQETEGPSAAQVRGTAERFFADAAETQAFAYLHFLEPHAPYTPPSPWSERFDPELRGFSDGSAESLKPYRTSRPSAEFARNVVALYDGNLAFVDDQLRQLTASLKQRGQWESTVFVLLSDHGEAFWEHGSRGHGLHVYEEFLRVPLLVRIPGHGAMRIPQPIELVDLLPTLCDLFGIARDDVAMAGRSLLPLLVGDALAERPVHGRNHEYKHVEFALREGELKMIHELVPEGVRAHLYDLRRDPGELDDLLRDAAPSPETVAMYQALARWATSGAEVEGAGPLRSAGVDSLDAESLERLKAMGYLN